MTDFFPLTSNPTKNNPVLLIAADGSYLDLQECAEQRLSAVRGLMHSLSCMKLEHAGAQDLSNVAEAAALLLDDAHDLFKAAGAAAKREGCKHA
ncbi:hypothetical protein [Pseudomonas sp. YY-1]|uniref:hypothetical protein n=1 Tax=Pseudomonas sp. YY-1 TaxID=2058659 RepID=UPI0015AB3B1D|nr:hypothetical protein [Pseudomonas sp. YY-1]